MNKVYLKLLDKINWIPKILYSIWFIYILYSLYELIFTSVEAVQFVWRIMAIILAGAMIRKLEIDSRHGKRDSEDEEVIDMYQWSFYKNQR